MTASPNPASLIQVAYAAIQVDMTATFEATCRAMVFGVSTVIIAKWRAVEERAIMGSIDTRSGV